MKKKSNWMVKCIPLGLEHYSIWGTETTKKGWVFKIILTFFITHVLSEKIKIMENPETAMHFIITYLAYTAMFFLILGCVFSVVHIFTNLLKVPIRAILFNERSERRNKKRKNKIPLYLEHELLVINYLWCENEARKLAKTGDEHRMINEAIIDYLLFTLIPSGKFSEKDLIKVNDLAKKIGVMDKSVNEVGYSKKIMDEIIIRGWGQKYKNNQKNIKNGRGDILRLLFENILILHIYGGGDSSTLKNDTRDGVLKTINGFALRIDCEDRRQTYLNHMLFFIGGVFEDIRNIMKEFRKKLKESAAKKSEQSEKEKTVAGW